MLKLFIDMYIQDLDSVSTVNRELGCSFLCLFLDKEHINVVFVSEGDDYYTP